MVARLGIGAPFWINAISNLGIIGALLWWNPPQTGNRHLPAERFGSAIRAGFRFLGDDEEDGFEFCDRLADIVEKPALQPEYDFGSDAMVVEARRLFQSEPGVALSIKPPSEALLFYRSAAGLSQDLRLLKARGSFQPMLKEIEARA